MPFAFRAVISAVALIPLLSACGEAGGGQVQSASAAVTAPRPARVPSTRRPQRHAVPLAPVIQQVPGLETVIGATAAQLSGQFGEPRLDVWEGDARKLQFSGEPCVLDVYLYPREQGREPQATYVDARRADGQDTDKLACATALRKR